MILKTERKKLKRLLKNRYIDDVLELLAKKNITTENGEPFSRGFISNVFNGREEHENIEHAIYDIYEKRKIKVSKMKARKAEILKPAK